MQLARVKNRATGRTVKALPRLALALGLGAVRVLSLLALAAHASADPTGVDYTLTLLADPTMQVVGGSSVLTATVMDQYGSPVDGATVTFMTDLGHVASPRVTMNGIATSQISSTVAGTAYIVADSEKARGTAAVTFIPGPTYAIALLAYPTLLTANGTDTSVITATVVDQFGNPVADGTLVSFSAVLGSVSTPQATTNGLAVATFTAGTLAGTGAVTATAEGHSDSINLTLVSGLVDLSSSVKLASVSIITETGRLTYTIILTNSGNLSATNVVLTDPIPLGAVFMPGSLSSGVTYNPSLDQIEWNGSVPANGSVRLTFAVTVAVTESRVMTNNAGVNVDGVRDRVLTAETQIIPSPPSTLWHAYLPVVARSSVLWHVYLPVVARSSVLWHVYLPVVARSSILWRIYLPVVAHAPMPWHVYLPAVARSNEQ